MPSNVIERPKMTKATYQALKRHIMHERERKKQAEQEQDEALERIRKERELRKKKEEEDSLTLEQTIKQIQDIERHMEDLKQEKHQLFTQLKSVLHHEETRKKVQTKENSTEIFSLAQQFHPNYPILMPAHLPSSKTRYLAVSSVSGTKRTRSPSPPPALASNYFPSAKYPATQYPSPAVRPSEAYANMKPIGHVNPVQSTHVTYSNQSPLAYHQPGQGTSQTSIINLPHGAAISPHYMKNQAGGGAQFVPPPHSYPNASQSAFSSYPSPYAQQQQSQQQQRQPANIEYLQHRLAQPGYFPQQMANLALQQLEHASQKNSSRQIQGLSPGGANLMALSQQAAPPKGSIVTGYPIRPPSSSTVYQNIPGSSQSVPNMAAKHGYGNQNLPRYSK